MMFWKKKPVDEGPPPKDPPPGDEDAVAFEEIDCNDPNLWPTKHPLTGKLYLIPITQVQVHIIGNPKRGFPLAITSAGGGEARKQLKNYALAGLGVLVVAGLAAANAAYQAYQAGEDPRAAAEAAATEKGTEKGQEVVDEAIKGDNSSTTNPNQSPAASTASNSVGSGSNNAASPDSSTATPVPMLIASLPILNAWPPTVQPASKVDLSVANSRMDELQKEKAEITKRQKADAEQSAKLDKDIATLQARIRLQQRNQYLSGVSDNVRRNAAPIPTPVTRYNDSSAASSAQSAAGSAAQAEASAQSASSSAGSAASSAGSSSQSASQSLQSLIGALNATDNGFNTPAASPVVPQQ